MNLLKRTGMDYGDTEDILKRSVITRKGFELYELVGAIIDISFVALIAQSVRAWV